MGNQYTSDRYGTRQTVAANVTSNHTAGHTSALIKFKTAVLVREVLCGVVLPGTTAGVAFNIYKNTTSIGAVGVTTGTELQIDSAALTDTTFATTDYMAIKGVASDATLQATILVDYNELYTYTD
jgi:hypothetical protein